MVWNKWIFANGYSISPIWFVQKYYFLIELSCHSCQLTIGMWVYILTPNSSILIIYVLFLCQYYILSCCYKFLVVLKKELCILQLWSSFWSFFLFFYFFVIIGPLHFQMNSGFRLSIYAEMKARNLIMIALNL